MILVVSHQAQESLLIRLVTNHAPTGFQSIHLKL